MFSPCPNFRKSLLLPSSCYVYPILKFTKLLDCIKQSILYRLKFKNKHPLNTYRCPRRKKMFIFLRKAKMAPLKTKYKQDKGKDSGNHHAYTKNQICLLLSKLKGSIFH